MSTINSPHSLAAPVLEVAAGAKPANKGIYGAYTAGADFLAANLAWVAFFALRRYLLHDVEPGAYFSLALSSAMVSIFWVSLYGLAGLYGDVLRRSRIKDLATVAAFSLLGAVILVFSFFMEDASWANYTTYLRTAAMYLVIHTGFAMVARIVWLTRLKNLVLAGKVYYNTILVGSERSAKDVYEEVVRNNPHLGIRFVGFVHVDQDEDHLMADELVHLGHYTGLEGIIATGAVEQAIIAIEPSEHALSEAVLNTLEDAPVRTFILPDTYQILLGAVRPNHILGTPLIEVKHHPLPVWQQVAKRGMDIAAAVLVFLFFWPVYLVTAVLVWRSSPGPILFKQLRVGRGGREFAIYKFRSMYVDAEKAGPALSSEYDPRITPFGRFMRKVRLDELPQFYNVLIGDMSLVGPRPERRHYIEKIATVAPHIKYVNRVRPGITSLGMVKFGYAENVDQMVRRLRYDIMYIENMSLAMDLRILAFTVLIVLRGKGK